jgi:small subunit ribosomal protein S21
MSKAANVFIKITDASFQEKVLRKFKRLCDGHGILKEYKARKEYKKPSEKKKEKEKMAGKRRVKVDKKTIGRPRL